jgi:acetyltransferase-like isoleucine patch superfamily enzyme
MINLYLYIIRIFKTFIFKVIKFRSIDFSSKLYFNTFPRFPSKFKLHSSVVIVEKGAELIIGKDVYIGHYNNIRCSKRIVIGSGTKIAQFVTIVDLNYDVSKKYLNFNEAIKKEVIIGENVWIGSNSVILAGVTIGNHSVIAAGSIVTKNVLENTIVAGNPAELIRKRF